MGRDAAGSTVVRGVPMLTGMEAMADKVWILIAFIAAFGVLGILHVVAGSVRNQVHAHDLRKRVDQLKVEQAELAQNLPFTVRDAAPKQAAPQKKAA
jgi:formate/nitrite transporter FocA (FNT family)